MDGWLSVVDIKRTVLRVMFPFSLRHDWCHVFLLGMIVFLKVNRCLSREEKAAIKRVEAAKKTQYWHTNGNSTVKALLDGGCELTSKQDQKEQIKKLEFDLAKVAEEYQKVRQSLDEEQMHNRSLAQKNNELTTKLSAEMGKKVAADESSVENVNIKNRPMNIADEYIQFCSNEWLAAKSVLDEADLDDLQEVEKVQLLFQILMVTEEEMMRVHRNLLSEIQTKMHDPTYETSPQTSGHNNENEYRPSKTEERTESEDIPALPLQVTNALGDYLRNQADHTNLHKAYVDVVQAISDTSQKISVAVHELWRVSGSHDEVTEYIASALRLCWKMAIQRPPMSFRTMDEYLGDKFQDLYWKSENPKTELPTKLYHVFPMLYHGQSLMVKGKVYLVAMP